MTEARSTWSQHVRDELDERSGILDAVELRIHDRRGTELLPSFQYQLPRRHRQILCVCEASTEVDHVVRTLQIGLVPGPENNHTRGNEPVPVAPVCEDSQVLRHRFVESAHGWELFPIAGPS